MREILFRGKRVDNGEWVYGDLVHIGNKSYISYYYESALSTFINETFEYDGISIVGVAPFIEVVPSTVGQYIGLLNKNDKKIFEGDIVEFPDHGNGGTKIGQVNYNDEDTLYEIIYEEPVCITLGESFHGRELEVIGNIHDNPELLEVEE